MSTTVGCQYAINTFTVFLQVVDCQDTIIFHTLIPVLSMFIKCLLPGIKPTRSVKMMAAI